MKNQNKNSKTDKLKLLTEKLKSNKELSSDSRIAQLIQDIESGIMPEYKVPLDYDMYIDSEVDDRNYEDDLDDDDLMYTDDDDYEDQDEDSDVDFDDEDRGGSDYGDYFDDESDSDDDDFDDDNDEMMDDEDDYDFDDEF
ncbi:hypothetical protein [Treponema sp.]|uniref:hypothetical protein n=1 Tax=Treponema sp. TaxID=166 RepID=UPI00298E514E|nr:hypothetical protein [Treponema sp.]